MKKLISLALALVMILSLATVAFATTGEDDADGKAISWTAGAPAITKIYTVNGGTAPAETFNFTFDFKSFTSPDTSLKATGPALTVASAISFESAISSTQTKTVNVVTKTGDDADTTLDLTKFPQLGYYYYEVKETAGTTLGVDYSKAATAKYLCVEIYLNDDGNRTCQYAYYTTLTDKTKTEGEFENVYTANKLTVSKTVDGSMGDGTGATKFLFTITFDAPQGNAWTSDITATPSDNAGTTSTETVTLGWNDAKTEYKVLLGNGDNVEFTNLPKNLVYTVTEVSADYTSSLDDDTTTGTMDGKDATVAVTNTLNRNPSTGIVLDSMPYIILLTLAAAGMFVLLTKKRAREF